MKKGLIPINESKIIKPNSKKSYLRFQADLPVCADRSYRTGDVFVTKEWYRLQDFSPHSETSIDSKVKYLNIDRIHSVTWCPQQREIINSCVAVNFEFEPYQISKFFGRVYLNLFDKTIFLNCAPIEKKPCLV